MTFKFKRTVPAKQVSVALSAREWEVVRKALLNDPDLSDLPLYEMVSVASWGVFLESLEDYASFLEEGTKAEDVEVKVGDEVLYAGEWLPVVALSRNGEEAVVDGGDSGVYVLSQDDVHHHRPAQEVHHPGCR